MSYQGVIKRSRTYDALAIMGVMTATQPFLMDLLTEFSLSPKWITMGNFIFVGYLAYLRSVTTGPVGSPTENESQEQ